MYGGDERSLEKSSGNWIRLEWTWKFSLALITFFHFLFFSKVKDNFQRFNIIVRESWGFFTLAACLLLTCWKLLSSRFYEIWHFYITPNGRNCLLDEKKETFFFFSQFTSTNRRTYAKRTMSITMSSQQCKQSIFRESSNMMQWKQQRTMSGREHRIMSIRVEWADCN